MKKYICVFCNNKIRRDKMAEHIEKEHDNELPENFTAYRMAYDIINGHLDTHSGECMICRSKTGWNNRTQKYFRICKDPKCKQAVKDQYEKRMLRVHNKPYLTDDPKHLIAMLAGRRISGKYKWSDGSMYTYTGSYEKNFLEFLDKTMEFESRQVFCPGPVLVYKGSDGKDHKWITDFFLPDFNLIIEIKDGGDNKNNKPMFDSRERMVYKEKMITSQGTYNYLKLTNNNFGQLLAILAELKMKINDDDTSGPIFRVNEAIEAGIDPYLHYAEKVNYFTEIIRECLDSVSYIPEGLVINAIDGLYESSNGDEISALAILYPDENNVNFEDSVNIVHNEIGNLYSSPKDFIINGFYLDEDDHSLGYLLGIELVDMEE